MRRIIASGVLVSIVLLAALGLPVLLSGSHHHDCPLLSGFSVVCEGSAVEHLSLWQLIFAALLILGLSVSMRTACGASRISFSYSSASFLGGPLIQTLMQRLYSRGIHNRKEHFRV